MTPRARSTARSDSGSAPTTSTVAAEPSLNTARPPVAEATTWALVSSSPSSLTTTPEPAPPRPPGPLTSSAATCGAISAATVVTTRE